jgi:hypothetical protein
MTIEQAFKSVTGLSVEEGIVKAYSEGWRHRAWPNMKQKTIKEDTAHALWFSTGDGLLLYPLFWKCLGKAMVWKEYCQFCGYDHKATAHPGGWKFEWHRFIDALAE